MIVESIIMCHMDSDIAVIVRVAKFGVRQMDNKITANPYTRLVRLSYLKSLFFKH